MGASGRSKGLPQRVMAFLCAMLLAFSCVPGEAFAALLVRSISSVSDLQAQAAFAHGAALTWTAPADGDGAPAVGYDLRYSTSPIASDGDFEAATSADASASPAAPGSQESLDVTGLQEGTRYYFALKWRAADGSVSALSDIASVVTLAHDQWVMRLAASPLYAPNDYTTFAFQFTADAFGCGLEPNARYYYRVVLSKTERPDAATDRGWTALDYNVTDTSWTNVEDPWTACPKLETDGNGKPNSGPKGVWSTLRVGDTRVTGTRYINVELIQRDENDDPIPGTEKHTVDPVAITVFDPTTQGAWIHNGVVNPFGQSRLAVTDLVPYPDHQTYSLSQGYPRWNQPDDPYWGTPDQWLGSVRFCVPLGLGPLDIRSGNSGQVSWAGSDGSTVTGLQVLVPGASYAFGASDPIPPSAPTSITASSRGLARSIRLSWSGASDDTSVTGYYVYRWQDIEGSLPYTPLKQRIAEVRDATSYVDDAVALGQTYRYEVRAFDAASNVSPAIDATATSENGIGPATITDLTVTSTDATSATLTWTAVPSASASGATRDNVAYDLRYSREPITTDAEFAAAARVTGTPAPASAGTRERFAVIDRLFNGQRYFFAIRAIDVDGLVGQLSDSAEARMPLGSAFSVSAGGVSVPAYVPNDDTAVLVRLGGNGVTQSGLAPSARYLARVVFSQSAEASRTSDRGWTAYGTGYPDDGWRRLDEPWETFEASTTASRCVLATDASGQLTGPAACIIARFGDRRVSGTWHVGIELVAIDAGGSPIPGSTRVLSDAATVSVYDAEHAGFGVHNGWAPDDASAGEVAITPQGDAGSLLAATGGAPAFFGEEPPAPWTAPTVSAGAFSASLPMATTAFDVRKDGAVWTGGDGALMSYSGFAPVAGASYALGSPTEPTPVAPAAVGAASADASGLAGALRLTWSASASFDVAGYRVYRWEDAPDGALYTEPHRCVATVGKTTGYTDTGLAEGHTYRYAVRALDEAGNLSPACGCSGVARDSVAPGWIADLSVEATGVGSVSLAWTAPADVSAESTHAAATSYDVRYSKMPILSAADFAAASKASGAPVPATPGTLQRFTVTRLTNGSVYYFAIRSTDAAGNVSAVSDSPGAFLPALPTYDLRMSASASYIADDYTPELFQIATPATGSGLAPDAVYYYKVVFSELPQHDTDTDRGWTAADQDVSAGPVDWVQAGEDWSRFPTLTTDANGAIVYGSSNGLGVYACVGDTRVTGDRYVQVVLARRAASGSGIVPGSEVYPASPARIAVFDPTTSGAWVHNGIVNTSGSSRISLASAAGATASYALCEGYPRWLYAADDSPYASAIDPLTSLAGSFRMAVPFAAGAFGVYTGNNNARAWMAQEGLRVSVPGASYALGASDMVPPSAPATVTASSDGRYRDIEVSWSGASDDNAVAGYFVYRWQAAPAGARYTPRKVRVAMVTDGTDWVDTAVTLGQTYCYEVRSFDAASNVSPAIGTSAVSRDAIPPRAILDLAATRTAIDAVRLTWTAPARADGSAVASYQLRSSRTPIVTLGDFLAATPVAGVGLPGLPGTTETCFLTGLPAGDTYYSIRSVDMQGNSSPISNTVTVSVLKDSPSIALTSVSRRLASYGASFGVTGTLKLGTGALASKTLVLQSSTDGTTFVDTGLVATTSATGRFSFSVVPMRKTWYRVRLAETPALRGAVSSVVYAYPVPLVGTPSADAIAYRGRALRVTGVIKPGFALGAHPVRVYLWRYVNGSWESRSFVTASVRTQHGRAVYVASVRFPAPGQWRLRAYHPADAVRGAAWSSGYRYVTVR